LVGEAATSFERILSQGGGAVTVAQHISLLLMFVSLLECVSQIQRAQTSQSVAEKADDEQPKKAAMPTFTYRAGL